MYDLTAPQLIISHNIVIERGSSRRDGQAKESDKEP
jgi:hypothetical protein